MSKKDKNKKEIKEEKEVHVEVDHPAVHFDLLKESNEKIAVILHELKNKYWKDSRREIFLSVETIEKDLLSAMSSISFIDHVEKSK